MINKKKVCYYILNYILHQQILQYYYGNEIFVKNVFSEHET